MNQTPTSPITATDKSGKVHSFSLDFGARRRVMRRLRALQLRGELPPDLNVVNSMDNLEMGYVTLWESRIDKRATDEDAFLETFDRKEVVAASNALWIRFQGEENPPTPGTESVEVSQASETRTPDIADSGANGSRSD